MMVLSVHLSAQTKDVSLSKAEREDLAKQQLDNKEYDKSIENYNILINQDTNNAYYFNQRGLSYYNQGNMKKAKENFTMATLYSEKNGTYWANLSAVYNNLNDDKKSYETALKALLYDKSELSIFNAGSAANNYNMLDKGIEILTNVGEFYHNDQEELLARLYNKKEDYEKSVEHYQVFFKNYSSDASTVPFKMIDDKRIYFFSLIGMLYNDANNGRQFNNKTELADTFWEVVNATGYQYEEKFVASATEWMRFAIKGDPSYKSFFSGLSSKIKNPEKQKEYITSLQP